MPIIPVYDGPQVEKSALPTVRNNNALTGAFGTQVADAVMQSASIINQANEQADKLRVNEPLNRLRETSLALSVDPKTGYRNRQGKDFVVPTADGKTLSDDYMGQLDAEVAKLESGLTNERQKRLFRERAQEYRLQFQSGLKQHESAQMMDYARKQSEASIILLQNEAALHYKAGSPGINPATGEPMPSPVQRALRDIEETLLVQRQTEGWPQAFYEAKKLVETSKVHEAVIGAALENKDYLFAETYFKQHGDKMVAQQATKLSGLIEDKLVTEQAMTSSDEVFETFAVKKGEPPTLEEMQDEWRRRHPKAPPEQAKTALSNLAYRHKVRMEGQAQVENEAFEAGYEVLVRGGNYASIPASILARIPGDKKAVLKNYSDGKAEKDTFVDTPIAQELHFEILSDPEQLAATPVADIVKLRPQLGPKRVESILKERDTYIKSPEKAAAATIDVKTFNGLADQAKLPKSDREEAYAAIKVLIDNEQRAKGGRLTEERKQQIIKEQLVKVPYKHTGTNLFNVFGSDQKRVFEMKNLANVEVPETDTVRIKQILTGAGYQATPENIRRYFIKEKANAAR